MDNNSIVSFVRIIRMYPEIVSDKRKFHKKVDSLIEDTFNLRRKRLREGLNQQKKEIFECFDKYNEIMKNKLPDAITNDENRKNEIVDELIKAFFPEEKENQNDQEA